MRMRQTVESCKAHINPEDYVLFKKIILEPLFLHLAEYKIFEYHLYEIKLLVL